MSFCKHFCLHYFLYLCEIDICRPMDICCHMLIFVKYQFECLQFCLQRDYYYLLLLFLKISKQTK